MSTVVYTGTSDFQVFEKQDFEKAGVDQGKLTFAQGEPKDVDEAVAEALTSKEGIFGDFSFEQVENEDTDLHGKELDEALTAAGLSKSGTVKEKQARLAEYQQNQDDEDELT